MKQAKHLISIVFIILLILFFIYVIVSVANIYLSSGSKNTDKICTGNNQQHTILIKNDNISPTITHASFCDNLTIINQDDKIRLIAFGDKANHTEYNNVSEKLIGKNQKFTLSLNKPGKFTFHDHYQQTVSGFFIVIE